MKKKKIKTEAEKTALRLSSFTTSPEHCIVLHPCCKVTYPLRQHPVEEVGRQGVKSMRLHILHLKQQECKVCSFSVFKTLDKSHSKLGKSKNEHQTGGTGCQDPGLRMRGLICMPARLKVTATVKKSWWHQGLVKARKPLLILTGDMSETKSAPPAQAKFGVLLS